MKLHSRKIGRPLPPARLFPASASGQSCRRITQNSVESIPKGVKPKPSRQSVSHNVDKIADQSGPLLRVVRNIARSPLTRSSRSGKPYQKTHPNRPFMTGRPQSSQPSHMLQSAQPGESASATRPGNLAYDRGFCRLKRSSANLDALLLFECARTASRTLWLYGRSLSIDQRGFGCLC